LHKVKSEKDSIRFIISLFKSHYILLRWPPLILHSQTPSKYNPHILVKQTDLCYIFSSPKPLIGNLVRHILIILSIFLFSLTIISCSSSSDDGASTTSDNSSSTTTTSDNDTTTTSTTALVWDQGSWDSHNWQ